MSRTVSAATAALTILPLAATPRFAQAAEDGAGFMYPHMGWGGGIMMVFFWAAIIFLLFVLARSVNAMHQGFHHPPRTAIEILKERFARGEIDREEFEERRKILLH
jgi:putative membrane protein